MRHLKSGRKLKRTASHRRSLLCNLATSLFEHKKITTTEAKAKELRPFAEDLITKAKRAVARERQGSVNGGSVDVHARRMVARDIRNKAVLEELFNTIAPQVLERSGGYCRITKLGERRGDAGSVAVIELVDWAPAADGKVVRRQRNTTRKPAAAPKVAAAPAAAPVAEAAPAAEEAAPATDAADIETPTADTDNAPETAEGNESGNE